MSRSRFSTLILLAFAAFIGLAGCSSDVQHEDRQGDRRLTIPKRHAGDGPIKIVATTGMVADVARRVGGQRVQVQQLMGAGIDPHLYKATTADVVACQTAGVIFYNGLHLEGKMADLFERLAERQPVFAVTQYIPPEELLTEGQAYDPHVWFDVALWRQTIPLVRDVLSQYDEAGAAEYRRNAEAYDAELARLHEQSKRKLAALTEDRRVLVTAHDAFRYFGRAYDVEVHGIQGISTESEAGVREVNRLIDLLVTRKIKAVFIETSVSDQNVKSLLEGCRAKGHEVQIGGELFSDAMGKAGTPEGTYPGMVRHNVDTIVAALE